jgi:hypothetical protein
MGRETGKVAEMKGVGEMEAAASGLYGEPLRINAMQKRSPLRRAGRNRTS